MPKDYVPRNDLELKDWLANFANVLGLNAPAVGLQPADVTPITNASDAFGTALEGYQQQKTLLAGYSSAKKTKREDAIDILRPLVRRVNNHPGMTDQLRSLLGLRPSTFSVSSEPVESLQPLVALESRDGGAVTVHWGTEPGNEQINGKPAGVRGANIYRKKAGDEEYVMVAFSTRSPYYDTVTGPAADYTYVVRYRGTKTTDLSNESLPETIAARGELAA